MRLLLATDAWHPQVNGVVRTLDTVRGELERAGHRVEVLAPQRFRTLPCPTYPEIRLALWPRRGLERAFDELAPDAVHVATEGPIGLAARAMCLRRGVPFTTAFHTRFPEYVEARSRIPADWTWRGVRWFHGPAARVMVATRTLQAELAGRGLPRAALWSRGVDVELFRPRPECALPLPRPIFTCVGRVAVEKNVAAFLRLDLPGTKLVVGDGPQLAALRRAHPSAHFAGALHGEELARHYAGSDAFVFPSRTDTFGLVLLEALASGVPVAAYPVPGPLDVIRDPRTGALDEDLGRAALRALELDRGACRTYALEHSWSRCAARFLELLEPFGARARGAVPAASPRARARGAAAE